jgi:multiple sugar transport system substrate-binding protein
MTHSHPPRRLARRAPLRLAGTGLLAALTLITACSNASTSSTSGVLHIKLWEFFNGPDTPSATKIINDFNSSQSAIHVDDTTLNYQSLNEKLLTSIASGTGPDVATVGTDLLSGFATKGALEPLDDFYTSGKYPSAGVLVPATVRAAEINGHHYGIPLNFYTEMMCYNKDIFTKAHITPPTTWDQFAADVPALTVIQGGKVVQYAIALGDQTDTDRFWQPLLWNGGGGVVSQNGKTALLSDPKTLSALNFWVNLVKNQHASPIGGQGPAAEGLFTAGKAAMVPCGPWVVAASKQANINLGVAPMPSGPAGNFPWSGSLTWVVPKTASAAVRNAVYQFANFWDSKKSQLIFSTANGYPTVRTDVLPADVSGNPYVAIFGASDIVSDARTDMPGLSNASQINNEVFIPTLQKALSGQGSVDSLFVAANSQVQSLLSQ